MLDFSTCTECGRCQSQCPAWNTGKPLSPKLLIMNLRDHLFDCAVDERPKALPAESSDPADRSVAPAAPRFKSSRREMVPSCIPPPFARPPTRPSASR